MGIDVLSKAVRPDIKHLTAEELEAAQRRINEYLSTLPATQEEPPLEEESLTPDAQQ